MPEAFVVWFTGMPGAGKTTSALALKAALEAVRIPSEVLDSDVARSAIFLNPKYELSERDILFNAILFASAPLLSRDISVIIAGTGYRPEWRKAARTRFPRFVEVQLKCSKAEMVRRCSKDLDFKAAGWWFSETSGESIKYVLGEAPSVEIDTEKASTKEVVDTVLRILARRKLIQAS